MDTIPKLPKKFMSFRCFLDLLCNRDSFGYSKFDEYYPGLRQKLDRLNVTPEKVSKTRVSHIETKTIAKRTCPPVKTVKPFGSNIYSFGYHAANSTTEEYALRLRKDLTHKMVTNPILSNSNRVQRLRCILCCYKCDNGIDPKKHYREGRQTVKLCSTCKVAVCNKCEETFHNAIELPIPACVSNLKKYNKSEKSESKTDKKGKTKDTPNLRKRKNMETVTQEKKDNKEA